MGFLCSLAAAAARVSVDAGLRLLSGNKCICGGEAAAGPQRMRQGHAALKQTLLKGAFLEASCGTSDGRYLSWRGLVGVNKKPARSASIGGDSDLLLHLLKSPILVLYVHPSTFTFIRLVKDGCQR